VKTVYGITTGSYSDYRVVALFETRDQAETEAEAYNRIEHSQYAASVEEFRLFEATDLPTKHWTTHIAEAHLDQPTKVFQRTGHAIDGDEKPPSRPRVSISSSGTWLQVHAATAEAALKAANDEIATLKAKHEGIADA
jgi:hypothetical protein